MAEFQTPAAVRFVPSVPRCKLLDLFGQIEPLLFPFELVIQFAEDPDRAPLAPQVFVPADDRPVVFNTRIESPRPVDGVAKPEGDNLVGEVTSKEVAQPSQVAGRVFQGMGSVKAVANRSTHVAVGAERPRERVPAPRHVVAR